VIANVLQTRKHRVVFVTPTDSYELHLSREQSLQGLEIEEPIVADVVSVVPDINKRHVSLTSTFLFVYTYVGAKARRLYQQCRTAPMTNVDAPPATTAAASTPPTTTAASATPTNVEQ